jgi:hypothetical protein
MSDESDSAAGEMSAYAILLTSYMQAMDSLSTERLMLNVYENLESEQNLDKEQGHSKIFISSRNSVLGAYLDFLRSRLKH